MHQLKKQTTALLACICLLFSSCAGYGKSTQDLMNPPRLTPEQKAIEEALLASVVSGDISFKYPQSGNYRSAFIFQDIDADGQDEALVFYVTGTNDYARLSVLDRDESGNWQAGYELSGACPNVEFITFAHISGKQAPDVVVGWSDPDSNDRRLGVYSYQDKRLHSLLSGSPIYNAYLIDDVDRNNVDDLFLFTRNSGTREQAAWIHLFAFDGYSLEMVDELPLSTPLTDFAGVVAGRMSANSPERGIFIDEAQVGDSLVTEIFTLINGDLIPIVEQNMQPMVPASLTTTLVEETEQNGETAVEAEAAEATKTADTLTPEEQDSDDGELYSLYDLTRRPDTTALCADVNGDGVIEIPTAQALPGYEDPELADRLFLTDYNHLDGKTLHRIFSAVTNRAAGYQVQFPTAWNERVTVVSQPENNEWRFIEYNPDATNPLNDLSGELMRIRVVSRKDYQDKFLENYTVLATRGAFTYYGYIPSSSIGSLSPTMVQLQTQLFSLL